MALIAMVSAKGSPGVTTAALACTLSWSARTIMAECDPAGGDILAGYLASLEIAPMGLLQLAVAALRGSNLTDELPGQLIDLDRRNPGQRLVLPGISSPVQVGTVRPSWEPLAGLFAGLEDADPGYDVIADCGRLTTSAPPHPVLHRADLALLVVRIASLRTISPAVPAVDVLRKELTEHGRGSGSLGVMLIGNGPYDARDVEQRLQAPVLAHLPEDRRTAQILSDGGRLRGNQELLRAAASAEGPLARAIQARRAHLAPATEASRA